MKRPLYSAPEGFSLSPLLYLLPTRGKIGKLDTLTSSLYARYESVSSLARELNNDDNREAFRRFSNEEGMLREVLDWLAVKPDGVNERG